MKLRTGPVLLVAATLLGLYSLELLPERAIMKEAMVVIQNGFNEITASAVILSSTSESTISHLNNSELLLEEELKLKNSSTTKMLSSNATKANSTAGINTKKAQKSPLNDQTVHWDISIRRPWLDPTVPNPPAILLLTTYGWNQPNQTIGITLYRSLRTAVLLDGIVNHPWFHPTAWDDINSGKMEVSNETRYYIFLDSETCGEKNYPRYGHGHSVNRDALGGRGTVGNSRKLYDVRWEDVMTSRVLRAQHATYVIFDCCGLGPEKFLLEARKQFSPGEKLALISLSNTRQNAKPWDQGLPPPACRKFHLDERDESNINTCNEASRSILISFTGMLRSATRKDLYELGKIEDDVVIGNYKELNARLNRTDAGEVFYELAKQSSFAAASRGDNLFSYRFSEVIACGAIPVVYADDWLLPFGGALINWTEVVVVIRENETMRTKTILSQISLEQRCLMRQRALEIYRTYIETGRGTIDGIIKNFELQFKSE